MLALRLSLKGHLLNPLPAKGVFNQLNDVKSKQQDPECKRKRKQSRTTSAKGLN